MKRSARKTKVQPSQVNRKTKNPRKVPGEQFTPESYAQAIARTCKRHGLTHWFPYQLRHAVGARARRVGGLDAAQACSGTGPWE